MEILKFDLNSPGNKFKILNATNGGYGIHIGD